MSLIQKLLFSIVLISSSVIQADNLGIPGHFEPGNSMLLPNRGISMDQVLSDFGEPVSRNDAVGEPPITEWNYGDFRVYFEYQTVLHSVNLKTMIMPK